MKLHEQTTAGAVTETPVILVVDDEEAILRVLSKYLAEQYIVHTAASGEQALRALREYRVALVLLDIGLPDVSGFELIPMAAAIDPDTAVLMLSARNDAVTAVECMQQGADGYITKPVELDSLSRAINDTLRRRGTRLATEEVEEWVKDELLRLNMDAQRERERYEALTVATLEALVTALEAKDQYARGHSAQVADLAATIADTLGLDDDEVEQVRTAGRLHDIGNIGIREEVLCHRGPLTDEQYEHVKQHTVLGAQMLKPIDALAPIAKLVRGHHEHWDGKGYPDGLAGPAIPLGARILAAAEVYVALTNPRPYQEALSGSDAVERIRELAGTVLDPEIAHTLATVVGRRKTLSFVNDFIDDYIEVPAETHVLASPPPEK